MAGSKKNRGFLSTPPQIKDSVFGGITTVTGTIVRPDGQWDSVLPVYEPQSFGSWDTLACVSFSALNCIETLFNAKLNKIENFSDRYVAKASGTTANGNYLYRVGDTIKQGLVREWDWPAVTTSYADYYSEIPQVVTDHAADFTKQYKIDYEFVYGGETMIKDALRYAPLQVAVCSYGKTENGIIKSDNKAANHAMMLYGFEDGEYWKLFDHYANDFKKYAWDLRFDTILKYDVNNHMPSIPTNTLVQLVTPPGGFGLVIDNKLYIDDLSKILASWEVRNNGDTTGKVMAITADSWNAYKWYNLKNEPLN